MNVAIFASAYFPSLGGVEELCRQLAQTLTAKGHGVIVLTNRWPRTLPKLEIIDGVAVHRIPFRLPTESLKSKLTWLATGWSIRREMISILQKFMPDVLHVQCVSSNAAYAMMAQKALRVPLVVTLQGELHMDATGLFQRAKWAKRVMRDALTKADRLTACSKQTLCEAETWFGSPLGSRATVVYNGISAGDATAAALEPRPHARPYLFAIGRHVTQKGFDVLIDACPLLNSIDCDIVIAGDGPERNALIERAARLGLTGRVLFPGRLSHEQAAVWFAHAQLFVLPSRHEPFGIVNLEAMAAGLAVVATNVGGVPEVVVDGVTGILVEPQNPAALASAVMSLSKPSEKRKRFGEAGRARAVGFDWNVITDKYLELYRQVIGASR